MLNHSLLLMNNPDSTYIYSTFIAHLFYHQVMHIYELLPIKSLRAGSIAMYFLK